MRVLCDGLTAPLGALGCLVGVPMPSRLDHIEESKRLESQGFAKYRDEKSSNEAGRMQNKKILDHILHQQQLLFQQQVMLYPKRRGKVRQARPSEY